MGLDLGLCGNAWLRIESGGRGWGLLGMGVVGVVVSHGWDGMGCVWEG